VVLSPAGAAHVVDHDAAVGLRLLARLLRDLVPGAAGVRFRFGDLVVEDSAREPAFGSARSFAFGAPGGTVDLVLWGDLDPAAVTRPARHVAELAERYVGTLERDRDKSETIARLEATVSRDPLTGAVSRVLLEDRLDHAQAIARRDGRQVGLMYLDLDRFKEYNDLHGHLAGDKLLVAFTRRVMQAVRPGDTVARLGGDEFLVVCESVDDEASLDRVVHRIERSVGRPYGPPHRGGVYRPSVSVGATMLAAAEDATAAIQRADEAMYTVKRQRAEARLVEAEPA
jgi:diguanylate cyclase (GGDEF)-like protein